MFAYTIVFANTLQLSTQTSSSETAAYFAQCKLSVDLPTSKENTMSPEASKSYRLLLNLSKRRSL